MTAQANDTNDSLVTQGTQFLDVSKSTVHGICAQFGQLVDPVSPVGFCLVKLTGSIIGLHLCDELIASSSIRIRCATRKVHVLSARRVGGLK
jgi:hypothetical protein